MSGYQKRNSDWQAYGQTYGANGNSRHWRRLQRLKRQAAQRRTGGKK